MQHRLKFKHAVLMSALVGTSLMGAAVAETNFPTKPVTLIVGYTAGGGTDLLARAFTEKLGEHLGQTVIVENRPGVSSIIGANYVAKARPDGYTLLMGMSGPIVFNPGLYKSLPYDPQKDLTPVSLVASFPLVLFTQAENKDTSTMEGLIKYIKANPDKANYGSSSAAFQLPTELFAARAGVKLTNIPYKAASESLMGVMRGDAVLTIADTPTGALNNPRVRPLAVTSNKRMEERPEIPTLKELGYDVETELFGGVFAPAGTPPAVIKKLNEAMRKTIADPSVHAKIKAMSVRPESSTPEELAQRVAKEIPMWADIARRAGIEPQ